MELEGIVLKATQKEPVGSTLWSCLVAMSAVQGLEEEYGPSSSQKATVSPGTHCICLSKAVPWQLMLPGVVTETGNVCRWGWMGQH